MKEKRVILCDFDGTLIHGDLERMFMRYLLLQPEVKYKMLAVSILTLPLNTFLNQLGFPSIMKSWTFALKEKANQYIVDFLKKNNENIKRKEEGWLKLQSISNARSVLLTGCYGNLIRAYLQYNQLDSIFDEVIATEMQNNLFIKQHPYARGKVQFVNKQNYNIGIANEKSDHFYLDICDERYYV